MSQATVEEWPILRNGGQYYVPGQGSRWFRTREAAQVFADWLNTADEFTPSYSAWRHGGWYVDNVRYFSGAVGCVSRNFADRKWRIVDETGVSDLSTVRTFPNRDAAARAEYLRANEQDARIREYLTGLLDDPEQGELAHAGLTDACMNHHMDQRQALRALVSGAGLIY